MSNAERPKFTVIITKCDKETRWYYNEIGKIFTVYRSSYDWILCEDVDSNSTVFRHIELADCKEVYTFWVIESPRTHEYYNGVKDLEGHGVFGRNINKALQFNTKEDAQDYINNHNFLDDIQFIPTEHVIC